MIDTIAKTFGVPAETLEPVKPEQRTYRFQGALGTVRYFTEDQLHEKLINIFKCLNARQTTDCMIALSKLKDGDEVTHKGWTITPMNEEQAQ